MGRRTYRDSIQRQEKKEQHEKKKTQGGLNELQKEGSHIPNLSGEVEDKPTLVFKELCLHHVVNAVHFLGS